MLPSVADQFDLSPQVRDKIGAEFLCRIGGGHFADAEAGEKSKTRQQDENQAGPGLLSGKPFAQPRPGDGSADDGNKGAEFEDTIAPGKFSLRQQFREQAVF